MKYAKIINKCTLSYIKGILKEKNIPEEIAIEEFVYNGNDFSGVDEFLASICYCDAYIIVEDGRNATIEEIEKYTYRG